MTRYAKPLVGLVAASLLLAGCGDAPDKGTGAENNEYGNSIEVADDFNPDSHFTWAHTSFASTWDPIKSINGSDQNFYEPVYDRLLFEEQDGTVVPMLATEFTPSEDNKKLTLTLQEGLSFSDGAPFDAEAVKFNLDRVRGEGSNIAGELYQVDSVNIIDPLTIELELSGGIGSLPVALANRAGIMVSPEAAKAGDLESEPVGIGPYVTTDIAPGDSVDYALTEDYWDTDAQRVATMTYKYMPDDQTRLNALKSGELDGARVNADEMDILADAGLIPLVEPSSLFIYFMVNAGMEPFDNPEVRKALNMAIDREAISEGLYDGYCTPQVQPFPEGSVGYSEKVGDGLDVYGYDPEAAKQILEEEGVTELSVATATPNVTIYTKLSEVLQSELKDIGIDLTINSVPPAEMVQQFSVDQVTETFTSTATGINDPDVTNSRYISADSLFNPANVEYPDLQKYGDEGAATFDPAERKPAYEKYMDAWMETPPHLMPICMLHQSIAVADYVSGVSEKANGYPDLRGVAVSKES
ncbi:ABC transporter substrate-binding protein [Cumulibacter soli]|uniref:ABC transporter substrate-binding protein n=1 Tax=Cumulibacter soli TaxID=2546344 RepID=UPI001067BEE8|nr:ABC transporter substrate-binding protein [Cumulibacter soli]